MEIQNNLIWFPHQHILTIWQTNNADPLHNVLGWKTSPLLLWAHLCLVKHVSDPFAFSVYKNRCLRLQDHVCSLNEIFDSYKIEDDGWMGKLILDPDLFVWYKMMLN